MIASLIVQAAQGVGDPGGISLLPIAGGGGVLGVLILAWRQERKEMQSRYEELAKDFRAIVQENTKAVAALTDKMSSAEDLTTIISLLVELLKRETKANIEP